MADISNQLQGADEGLERFIEALDNASIKLGSNAALESQLARQEFKRLNQEKRFKKKMQKMEAQQASQLAQMDALKIKEQKASLPILKKISASLKDRLKSTTVLNKGMKETIKGMKVFEKSMSKMKEGMKGGLGKGMTMIKGAAKAGLVGALILGIKVIVDGMLKIDKAMASLVKATGRARIGLEGLKMAAVETEHSMGTLGVNLEVATKEAANLSQQFGIIDKVTGDVVTMSLKLQMAYGVSAEAAGQLLVTMERLGKNTEEFVSNLAVKAVKAGVNVSLVMRDMASHAQQYAMYNERAQTAMENMAVQSARTGGSLDDIATISQAYATVEGISEAVGKVGTFFGEEVARKLGDPKSLYMMAELGMWDELQKVHDKAYKDEFKYVTQKNGLIEISNDLTRTQKRLIEEQTGESILVIQNRQLENAELDRMGRIVETNAEKFGLQARTQQEGLENSQMMLDIQKKMLSRGQITKIKKLSDIKGKDLINLKQEIRLRKDEIREAEKMNEIIKQSQTIVERFKNIFGGIWREFTTQMSLAFGLDDRGKDSAMGKVESFVAEFKRKLSLDTLATDIAKEGGGLTGFVGAMAKRLKPLFKFLKTNFITAMESAFKWIGENVTFNKSGLITGGPLFSTTAGVASEGLQERMDEGEYEKFARKDEGVGGFQAVIESIYVEEASRTEGQAVAFMELTKLLEDKGFTTQSQQEWAARELDKTKDVSKLKMENYDELKKSAEVVMQQELNQYVAEEGASTARIKEVAAERLAIEERYQKTIMYNYEQLIMLASMGNEITAKAVKEQEKQRDAAIIETQLVKEQAKRVAEIKILETQIADKQKKNAEDKKKGLAVDEKNIKDDIAKRDAIQKISTAYLEKQAAIKQKEQDAIAAGIKMPESDVVVATTGQTTEEIQTTAATNALGGIGGGLSIVGEAGGEVVTSRSALRDGIGIGGRAASALASIGVPGYYRGEAIESTYATKNLSGSAGALGVEMAGAFIAEVKVQQKDLVDYQRYEYDRHLESAAAGATEERESHSIACGQYGNGFFNAYPALIDRTLQKAFNVQDGVGKEMYNGVFTAMQAWSSGESPKKALMIGVQTALGKSLESGALGGFLDKLGEKNQILADGLKGAVAEFAATGSVKKTGKRLAKAGGMALMEKLLGADAMKMGQDYMAAGDMSGYLRQQELGARAQGFGGTGVDRRAEGFGNAATGKYVNSPTLMMVGEGGAGEVVIPTERIKKGLPINAGVANELASIGVPGFGVGGFLKSVGKGIGGVGKGIAKGVSKAGKFLFSNMMGGAGPAAAGGGAVGGSGGGFGGVKAIEKEAGAEADAEGGVEEMPMDPSGEAGAGGGGGGGIDAIIQLLSQILQTNSGIAPQISEANSGALGALQEGLSASLEGLLKMLTGFHAEKLMVLESMGEMIGGIGTDLSSRMGKQIGHLSTIDTKVASHPSEMQHKMKLTQGASKGASDAIGKAPPSPKPGGLLKAPATKMGGKGAESGARDAWSDLEGGKGGSAGGGGGMAGIATMFAATGKHVNSPTLMMVGEENRSEVVVPTERIRKGLPINAGVARELGSIGVPGFGIGGFLKKAGGFAAQEVLGGQGGTPGGAEGADGGGGMLGGLLGGGAKGGGGAGGLMGAAKGGAAAGLMTGFSTFMETGDWKQGLTAGVGGLAGVGIGAGLMALGVPPPLNTMIGNVAGKLVGKGLNKVFGVTGGQKKARKKSLKILEQHIKAGALFDFGQPSDLKKQMQTAIGGKENSPTEGNYKKLIDKVGGSRVLKPLFGAGFEPDMIVAMGQGQLKGKQAFDAYAAMNTALYGSAGGDKYMQAMQVGPQLAEGGIVTRPTQAIIGERGPEVVIPLTEQRKKDKEMIDEMKKQNKLMMEMIKTQKETGKAPEIRLDGRKISESVGENFYDIGSGQ